MKPLLLGILVIVIVGIGGLVYRNAVEHPYQPITCPVDKLFCPDGTAVVRTGTTCEFTTCPPPNVSLATAHISFALPTGFVPLTQTLDPTTVAAYEQPALSTSTEPSTILINVFPINASSTALKTIQDTAIGQTSGEKVSPIRFSAKTFNERTFTVVPIDRFEGVIVTAYYLKRGDTVLRFDAIDRGADWTNPSLNISLLPAHAALEKLLSTLQIQ
ncbi:MAG: hypothetical protein JWN18_736 [Parcubacteria group bacterium]|nr:hypothetical protein [Parcubacteria group bacterium]